MIARADLHELSCTGPDEEGNCACRPSKVRLLEMHRVAPDWQVVDYATNTAMDTYLDSLESLFLVIGQRELSDEQLDRFARLLQTAELTALRRLPKGGGPHLP